MEETVSIATPDNVTLEFELAGPGSRFAAYLIDGLLIGLLIIVVVVALIFTPGVVNFFRATFDEGPGWLMSWNIALLIFFIFLINWGYYVLFEGLRRGSTPGKRKMGIRVLRRDGLPIGFREAALRNLVRAADMLPPPCALLGGLVALFDREGRRLGDMVAGTIVVVEKFAAASDSAAAAAWAARVEQGRSRQALTLPQGIISANQIALIEQFMGRRHALPPARREALAWQIAEPLLSLLGEDREALVKSPDRLGRSERLLLQILDLARGERAKPEPALKQESRPALF
ncbi:MAG TPA: RDD family protein [Candidatus Binatia bacterium]|jgi:uncharacterized RDD family membrane protein YckC